MLREGFQRILSVGTITYVPRRSVQDVELMKKILTVCLERVQSLNCYGTSLVCGLPSLITAEPLQDCFRRLLSPSSNTLVVVVLWWAWCWRNESVFSQHLWPLHYGLRQIYLDMASWSRGFTMEVQKPLSLLNQYHPPNSIRVMVDGSWKPRYGKDGVWRSH